MGLEQIWLLEKLRERFKMNRMKTSIEIGFSFIICIIICYFGGGYLPEKGRQLASVPKVAKPFEAQEHSKPDKNAIGASLMATKQDHNIPRGIIILVSVVVVFAIIAYGCWKQWKKKINNDDLSKKAIAEEIEEKLDKVAVLKFPNVTWLTTKDVMKVCGFSVDVLKQHIENGLPGYIKNPENQELRPITERDLIALEVWSDESDSMVELWRFKTEDVERHIEKVGWLTGKEIIDKHDIGAIELYQYIKNDLNIYPKDFSAVMLTDHVQPLSKYDIGFEIEYDMAHSDEVYNILKNYHFKVCDIEKYIRANKNA